MAKSKTPNLLELLETRARNEQAKQRPPSGRPSPAVATHQVMAHAGELKWIPIELIDDNPAQPPGRTSRVEVADLIDKFNAQGQDSPALVRPHPDPKKAGRYEMVFGHRRKYAVSYGANAGPLNAREDRSKYLGLLLCIVRPIGARAEVTARALTENIARKQMTALQAAQVVAQLRRDTTDELVTQGYKIKAGELVPWRKLVEYHGLNPNDHVILNRTAALLDLPAEFHNEFEADENNPDKWVLNGRHARALLKLNHQPKAQKALLQQIKRERLGGAQAERLVDEQIASAQKPAQNAATSQIVETHTRSTPVTQKNASHSGVSELDEAGSLEPANVNTTTRVRTNDTAYYAKTDRQRDEIEDHLTQAIEILEAHLASGKTTGLDLGGVLAHLQQARQKLNQTGDSDSEK